MIQLQIGIAILIKSTYSAKVPSISALKSLNDAQFLNANCVAAVNTCFLWGWVPAGKPAPTAIYLVTEISPVTKIYASEWSQRLDSLDFAENFIGSWCE